MPCYCDPNLYNHTAAEAESGRVLELLKEIDGQPFNHDCPSYYGTPDTLDRDTARLCAWCQTHDVHLQSLELQLWWRKHQEFDRRREAEAARAKQQQRIYLDALAKLSPQELEALRRKL